MPAIGRSSPRKAPGSVRPKSPLDGRTSGSASERHPEQLAQLVAPAPAWMSYSSVRLALLGIGHVDRAAGQPGDEVGVDGADGHRAGPR